MPNCGGFWSSHTWCKHARDSTQFKVSLRCKSQFLFLGFCPCVGPRLWIPYPDIQGLYPYPDCRLVQIHKPWLGLIIYTFSFCNIKITTLRKRLLILARSLNFYHIVSVSRVLRYKFVKSVLYFLKITGNICRIF
jgi:hypothetical protein